jgi:hypothetical protein
MSNEGVACIRLAWSSCRHRSKINPIGIVSPFISYAREDRVVAGLIYRHLRENGASPWIDTEALLPGQNWPVETVAAIRRCTHFLALLSKNSVSKVGGFVQKELREAMELLNSLPPRDVFVIPIRLDDCEPRHEKLSELHWLDLFPDYEGGLRKLDQSLGLHDSGREISELDSYGLASTRQGSLPRASHNFSRDEDGFLTAKSVGEMVLARVQGRQDLRRPPILLFENSHQRTWLVVTDRIVACVLDDTEKSAGYDPLRWHCRHRFVRPIKVEAYKDYVGLIHFGEEHRDWLYTLRLHPDGDALRAELDALLR